MSRTRRTKWVPADDDNMRPEKGHPDSACKPGCRVCGKDSKKADRRRERHTRDQQIKEQYPE